jgi:hypothetical protein
VAQRAHSLRQQGVCPAQIASLIVKDCPCTDNVTLIIVDLHQYYSTLKTNNFVASDIGMISNNLITNSDNAINNSLLSGLSSPVSAGINFSEDSSVSSSSQRRSTEKTQLKRVPRPFNCPSHFHVNFDNMGMPPAE